ncbi:MAG TPA: TraR/DksA C4-type zinc finger protein [Steroidobacteraceae bacterium]
MLNLEAIAEALMARRVQLHGRISAVRTEQCRSGEFLGLDCDERAITRENDDVMDVVGTSAECELLRINEALQRIREGSYGLCTTCGSPIGAHRLRAIPYAERCSDCAATEALIEV